MPDAEEIVELRAAVLAYNGLLRTAHSIALRSGAVTNWPPFLKRVTDVLDAHHETFVRAMRAKPLPEAGPGGIGGGLAASAGK